MSQGPTRRRSRGPRRAIRRVASLLAISGTVGLASVAQAETEPASVTLQWFETDWNTIENRMPDVFVAGYTSVWLPPPSLASFTSVGYDTFERFSLGRPGEQTFYGTALDYKAMVAEFHRASAEVYSDIVLNHNGGRTGDANFHAAGGWPGFWANWQGGTKFPGGDWGDFNNGTTQSENPGAPNYNLWDGDLVSLVDIDQLSNNWTIRHPVDASTPEGIQPTQGSPERRIPEGTFRNQPRPENAALYPDLDLPAKTVNSPGISRGPFNEAGIVNFTYTLPPASTQIHPFNTADPMQGDPVMENAAALLGRWCQWMLDEFDVDGFRIDAIKHTDPIFFDINFDRAVFDRRTLPDGSTGTPFSFGESTASDGFTNAYYIRKDGFGNRDALDLGGAGNIRNIINARGLSFAGDLDNSHFDTVDGFNDGSLGLNHIYSHDNGTRGDGGSSPLWPYEDKMAPWAHAYVLLRTGRAIVYLNGRALIPNNNRFWPRRGIPSALGAGEFYTVSPSNAPDGVQPPTTIDDRYTTLVQLRKRYGRGFYQPRLNANDAFVFEREGNMIVGVSDSYTAGFQNVTVGTAFAPGTVLVEVTGNATDPEIDPTNQIFDTVTVQSGGIVSFRIPNNVSSVREHSTGYVVYAPQTPRGTLTFPGASDTILADAPTVPTPVRRLTEMTVVKGPTFDIDLSTIPNDFDSNHDDNALFRINAGYQDYNNDGLTSRDEVGAGEFEQYERFLTLNQPLFGTANANGRYVQTINTDDLPEGRNYISVVAFRNRASGADPAITDFRKVIYVDRRAPDIEVDVTSNCDFGSVSLTLTNGDRTVTDVRVFPGVENGEPTPPVQQPNVAQNLDRGVFTWGLSGVTEPTLDLAIVAIEDPGNLASGDPEVNRTVVYRSIITGIKGDVNLDGAIDPEDIYAAEALAGFECRADIDADADVDADDAILLRDQIRATEITDALASR